MNMQSRRKLLLLTFTLAVLGLVVLGCGGEKKTAGTATGPSIEFVRGYDQALAAAKEKGKPVLIDFSTDWCRWCKVLDTVNFVDSGVIALSDKIIFAKVDAEADTMAADENAIRAYPSLLLFDSNGKEIDRIVGYLPPEEFIETINNYLNGIGTLDYYLAVADTGATPENNFAIAEKYRDRSMYEKAETYYNDVIKNNPDNENDYTSNSMMSLAEISLSLDKYDEAVKRYKEVKAKFADSAIVNDADIMIAISYRQKADTVAAIKAFEDFLKNHPNSQDTGYVMGQIERLKNPPEPTEE